MIGLLFFFSSRRRHTRSYGDWSSDVCSSDLIFNLPRSPQRKRLNMSRPTADRAQMTAGISWSARSEEGRVGKECRGGWGGGDCRKKREKRSKERRIVQVCEVMKCITIQHLWI